MVTPTRREIRQRATELYMENQARAGMITAPFITPEEHELKEGSYWERARLELMQSPHRIDDEMKFLAELSKQYIGVERLSSLERATRKWARKTANKGAKWKEATEAATAEACRRMAEFVGHPVPEWCSSQAEGVRAVSASEFASAIEGKADKWARGMKAIR